MTNKTLAGTSVDVDEEGFFIDANQWTQEMASEIAAEWEVPTPLTDQHWQVLHYMRKEYFDKGTGPTVRKLGKSSGVSVKELYKLFPSAPAKTAARCAGIPKPRGCI